MICNDDVWFNIFNFLSYRTLKSITLLSKQFYRIVIENDLLNKSKFYGFPRTEGTCKLFDILKDYSYILENDAQKCYDDDSIVHRSFLKKVEEHGDNIRMIRGDIVMMKGVDNYIDSSDDGSYTFDGCKLIGLCFMKQEEREIFLTNMIGDHPITLGYWYDRRSKNSDQYYSDHRYNCIMEDGKAVAKLNSRQEIVALTEEDIKFCKRMRINI